jgi:hypothetical protein
VLSVSFKKMVKVKDFEPQQKLRNGSLFQRPSIIQEIKMA